jgi:hypothetical protein
MINRLKIMLDQPEYSALLKLSERELRNPADQVRLLVREALIREGLIPDGAVITATPQKNEEP